MLLAADLDLVDSDVVDSVVVDRGEQASFAEELNQVSQNVEVPADVNADQHVSAADGLLLVNAINQVLAEPVALLAGDHFLDVSGDGRLSPDDFDEFAMLINRGMPLAATIVPNSSDSDDNVTPPDLIDDGASSGDPSGGGIDDGNGDFDSDDTSGPPASGDPTGGPGDTDTDKDGGSGPVDGGGGGGGGGSNSSPGSGTNSPGGTGSSGNDGPDNHTTPTLPDYGSAHCNNSLRGTTVKEGEVFALGLTIDTTCVSSYTVDWGDGLTVEYGRNDRPAHVYDDDSTVNTASDKFPVMVVLELVDGTTMPLQTTITVNNVAPKAADDQYSTDEDTVLKINSVLSNDDEPSFNDRLNLIVSNVDTTGTVGKVVHRGDGNFDYDPRGKFECLAEGETATDSFKYTIHDDDEPSVESTATVNIIVRGRREFYILSYGGGPQASEEGEVPATAIFKLSPPAKCGPITIGYHRVDYDGPAIIPMASDNDVKEASGEVTFQEGQSTVSVSITPVDDKTIEQTEWFYFTADTTDTADYAIHSTSENGFFKINDDEWRFVAEVKSDVQNVGPTIVEAFYAYGTHSLLTGAYSMSSTLKPNVGSTQDSTARVRADIAARLTRPGVTNNFAEDYTDVTFVCNSQTGDVWRQPVKHGGQVVSSPLSANIGMDYMIADTGSEHAIVVVDIDYEFLAGGEITKVISPGLDLSIGDKTKASTGGHIKLEKNVTYAGGVQLSYGDGFSLRCQKGG
jgi:hypothetical protein